VCVKALRRRTASSDCYDKNGNRTNPGYHTGPGNRLLNDGTYGYEYDPEGNLAKKIDVATGDSVEYTWDHRNRLVGVAFFEFEGTISGTWAFNSLPTAVQQDGNALLFVNENGTSSAGYFQDANTVVASDWGNLVGHLDQVAGEIHWDNGSAWTRSLAANGGNWQFNGQAEHVDQSGTSLTFTNENGSVSSGTFVDIDTVHATDWGVTGQVSAGKIQFNSAWTRSEPTPGVAPAGTLTKDVLYTYDVFDRLIRKQVDDPADGSIDRAEAFVYDGDDVVASFDAAGSLTHRYLHGPAVDQVFADEDALGEILWGLADNQGTVRDVVDYDAGSNTTTIANHRQFDAFGNITAETPAGVDFRYAYTGGYFDKDTGLLYRWHRWYDAKTARWITEDWILDDTNSYRYVRNGSTNAKDPSGLQDVDAVRKKRRQKDLELLRREFARGRFSRLYRLSKRRAPARMVDKHHPQTKCPALIAQKPKTWYEQLPSLEKDATRITIVVEVGMTTDIGHTGIGIDDRYYDYGPAGAKSVTGWVTQRDYLQPLSGKPGGPYWDNMKRFKGDASLKDILDNLKDLSDPENYSIFLAVVMVPKNRGMQIERSWKELYKNPGNYHFLTKNCTSTVAWDLWKSDVISSPAVTPRHLLRLLRKGKHTGGQLKGLPVDPILVMGNGFTLDNKEVWLAPLYRLRYRIENTLFDLLNPLLGGR
jgi:RHS repeat-associated protein